MPRGAAVPTRPTLSIPDEDIARIFANLRGNLKALAICSVFFGAGLRIGEVAHLDCSDVCFRNGVAVLILREGKTVAYEERSIPNWVYMSIAEYARGRLGSTESLFTMDEHALRYWFRQILKRCGINERYTPHSCRKTMVTNLLDAGATPRDVMKATGHRCVQTVMRYDDDKRKLETNPNLTITPNWRIEE